MSTAPLISREAHDILGRHDPMRRQRWRHAGRLWSFTCRAVPYGAVDRIDGSVVHLGAFPPSVLAEAIENHAPVRWLHGSISGDPAKRERPPEFGQLTAFWDTPQALYVTGFVCVPVQLGQTVSVGVSVEEWGVVRRGDWVRVRELSELSICGDPGTPAAGRLPGAEVLSVTELTRSEVEALRDR